MKVAVTGGAGFIGSHIADACINNGFEVVIIDNLSTGRAENINPAAKFIEMDITSDNILELFENEKFDVVSHQAAQVDVRTSVKDPRFDATTNIVGSLNIYEAARQTGVKKVVFASSGGTVYGEQDYFPADEDHPKRPCSPYGIAKLVNEHYLFYYRESYGLDYACLRYGNVYGPRQNPHGEAGVVAIFTHKMLAGDQPVINGDGLITRDYIYISDVVRANLLAIESNVSGCYNVTTGIETDVNHIFRTIKMLTGSDCEEFHGPAKIGEQRRAVCSPEKLSRDHGWKPVVDFDKGLEYTVEFFAGKLKSK